MNSSVSSHQSDEAVAGPSQPQQYYYAPSQPAAPYARLLHQDQRQQEPTRWAQSLASYQAAPSGQPAVLLVSPPGPPGPSSQEADGEEPDPDSAAAAATDEPPADDTSDEEQQNQEQPDEGSELVELAGRRSLDEQESDGNERARDGAIVRTHRRHLINGRPARRAGSARDDQKALDFEAIVDEIEASQPEEEDSPAAKASGGAGDEQADAGESRLHANVQPGGPRDSHQHRVRETLHAQQWDDDAASEGPAPAEPAEEPAAVARAKREAGEALSARADLKVELLAAPRPANATILLPAPEQQPAGLTLALPVGGPNPLASGTHAKPKRRPPRRRRRPGPKASSGSQLAQSKLRAAKAHSARRRQKSRKGTSSAARAKAKRKSALDQSQFSASSGGRKAASGRGERGARKGSLHHEDRGYKKRGFKKAYQKLESGDHKTYFDEFRDKDHSRRWKRFKDGHNYSKRKHWNGKDRKRYKHHRSAAARGKQAQRASWRDQSKSAGRRAHAQRHQEAAKRKKSSSR